VGGRVQRRKASIGRFGRMAAEIGLALVALAIVVGAAVALPVWISRSYAAGLAATMVVVSILILAVGSQRRRHRRF
jgi:hypothetical protein